MSSVSTDSRVLGFVEFPETGTKPGKCMKKNASGILRILWSRGTRPGGHGEAGTCGAETK